MKYYWKTFKIFLLELFLVSWMVLISSCASMKTGETEGYDIGSYKGVSNIEVLQMSFTGVRSAKAELMTFEVPYERLPVRDKGIVDANSWY